MPDICIVGCGHIGLPLAAAFVNAGMSVHGYDKHTIAVDKVFSGDIKEPGVADVLGAALENKKFAISNDIVEANVYIIAVPTPLGDDNNPDLSYFNAAIAEVQAVAPPDSIVLVESTLPIGETEKAAQRLGDAVDVAYCPERILPGRALIELSINPRIIGGVTLDATKRAAEIYKRICITRVVETTAKTAETVKLAENAYRLVNVAFANDIYDICAANGVDHKEVRELANLHPRVDILNPGPGAGGHCIPVDPRFIRPQTSVIDAALLANYRRPCSIADRISFFANGRQVILLGESYKPKSADIRESAAKYVCDYLLGLGHRPIVIDPYSRPQSMKRLANIGESDYVVKLVDHPEFDGIEVTASFV